MNSSLVYLVQTDTTVGFSSSSDERLSDVKQRPRSKKILHTADSFKTLKTQTRIPKKHRKFVRRSKRTTFIYPNLKSFRVVSTKSSFYDFIHKFGLLYSTSANLTGAKFQKEFAHNACDVVVIDKNNFSETTASKIYILSKTSKVRIR